MEKPIMPLIQLKLMEQVFTATQKKEIVSKLTDTVVRFEGKNMRPFTWVSIDEICDLAWSIGGPARTTGALPAFAAGKK
jgi:4-oxalocrotonate tautomerase